ncbi:hypothetical protein FH972_000908 [Carpinus fangiana]|uniref:Uncharacterized protein n=1 Tax=Carpinus fangiana TaxID=176857 RepID=A0A5N6QAG2_9ROSI|nr:hypothetical protein FH972_000908 [Carpinus fangiana]
MGDAIIYQPQLPLPAVLIIQQTLSPPKPSSLTPFSAVAPPRSVAVSSCSLQKTTLLETIYEEDNESECMETCQASSASFMAPPQFMCFLEVRKPLSAPYTHNCQCA